MDRAAMVGMHCGEGKRATRKAEFCKAAQYVDACEDVRQRVRNKQLHAKVEPNAAAAPSVSAVGLTKTTSCLL
jgi:hypothetical protein